ncbi:MAG: hypothetical protein PVF51_08040 [Nitrospirota bacterium]|jgi:hypothetical protein
MSDMDTRLRATFETFTDAELVDMVLDHSGTKSPKSQRIARDILDERDVQPIDYPGIIDAAEASGEIGRPGQVTALPRTLLYSGWGAAIVGAAIGYLVGRELILAGFVGAMAGLTVATVGRVVRRRHLRKKGLGHALKA